MDSREDADTSETSGSLDTLDDTFKTIMSMKSTNTAQSSEYDGLKPEDQELFQLCGKEDEFVKKMSE